MAEPVPIHSRLQGQREKAWRSSDGGEDGDEDGDGGRRCPAATFQRNVRMTMFQTRRRMAEGRSASEASKKNPTAVYNAPLGRIQCITRHVAAGHERQPNISTESTEIARLQNRVREAESRGISIGSEVRSALLAGRAIVALESTIIAHGMPYPQNLETAMEVEAIVRRAGAVPATIAIMDGVPKIGLTNLELERLAKIGQSVKKTSRRDIAHVVAKGVNGATTVSATMFFAAAAGIPVFVTGGIGGVHRNGDTTMDISADLTELGRTPVAVVCAGVKSILDIPRTLEFMETQGVTVAGYATDEFPAFFTASSGCRAPCRLDTPECCASLIAANRRLNLESGIVIAVPIPARDAAAGRMVEAAIEQALEEARGAVGGNDVTPFLLKRVSELTHGASLRANIALVKNNALVGAQIAAALERQATGLENMHTSCL